MSLCCSFMFYRNLHPHHLSRYTHEKTHANTKCREEELNRAGSRLRGRNDTTGQRSWEGSCLSASVPKSLTLGVWIQGWGSPSGAQVTSPGIQKGQRDTILSAWLGQDYSPPLLAEQSAKKTIELHKKIHPGNPRGILKMEHGL